VGQQRTQRQQQREFAIDTVMRLGGEHRAGAVAYLDAAKWVTETAVGSAVMNRSDGRLSPEQPLTSARYFATLGAPGLFVLVAGSGGTMPIAPEHSWLSFTICEHKQASLLAEVRLCGASWSKRVARTARQSSRVIANSRHRVRGCYPVAAAKLHDDSHWK
jgi:hypothetical protein